MGPIRLQGTEIDVELSAEADRCRAELDEAIAQAQERYRLKMQVLSDIEALRNGTSHTERPPIGIPAAKPTIAVPSREKKPLSTSKKIGVYPVSRLVYDAVDGISKAQFTPGDIRDVLKSEQGMDPDSIRGAVRAAIRRLVEMKQVRCVAMGTSRAQPVYEKFTTGGPP